MIDSFLFVPVDISNLGILVEQFDVAHITMRVGQLNDVASKIIKDRSDPRGGPIDHPYSGWWIEGEALQGVALVNDSVLSTARFEEEEGFFFEAGPLDEPTRFQFEYFDSWDREEQQILPFEEWNKAIQCALAVRSYLNQVPTTGLQHENFDNLLGSIWRFFEEWAEKIDEGTKKPIFPLADFPSTRPSQT